MKRKRIDKCSTSVDTGRYFGFVDSECKLKRGTVNASYSCNCFQPSNYFLHHICKHLIDFTTDFKIGGTINKRENISLFVGSE